MKISNDAKRVGRKLFNATVTDGKMDVDIVRKVVAKLASSKPRGYLGIIAAYSRFVRLEAERHMATVESAAELSSEMTDTVRADLVKKYGDQLTVSFAVNPDLLGGLRVKVGSDVWDGSVKNRLERLNEAFS